MNDDGNANGAKGMSRRHFVGSMAAAGAAAGVAGSSAAGARSPAILSRAAGDFGPQTAENYPPLRYGMRGDHPGSFPSAHSLRDGNDAPEGESTGEIYDLVIVGAGISGISAAWYYRERAGNDARILILDNHDDFGGHAKRNEFVYGGMQFLYPGGSSYMVDTRTWPHEATRLIKHLGIEAGHPGDIHHEGLYESYGMKPAAYFREETFGKGELVHGGTIGAPTGDFLDRTPLPARVKADLDRLHNGTIDYMPGLSTEEKIAKLREISYGDYLRDYVKIDPETMPFVDGAWCLSKDTTTAWFAHFRARPGFAGLGVERPHGSPESAEYAKGDYGTPGGNHSICRLIVRELIPDALPAGDFVAVESERTDYSTLDRPGQPTRIRLNSTVVRAKHVGSAPHQFEPDLREVDVTYVKDGRALKVRAKDVIMAGFNNMIPYICPEIPQFQKDALRKSVRSINLQTPVLLRNWEAFERMKVSYIDFPTNYMRALALAKPRSFGKMKASMRPDQPILVMAWFSHGIANETFAKEVFGGEMPEPGTPVRDQERMARMGLFNTPLERFTEEIGNCMNAALSPGGFDAERDIIAVAHNRWGHGYALGENALFDDLAQTPAYVVGRKQFGHIAIANSDASGIDNAQTAMEEAARAVRELEPRMYGYYGTI